MPTGRPLQRFLERIFKAVINLLAFLGQIIFDFSLVPLIITILSYYRLSTFQALQGLYYRSSSQQNRLIRNKDVIRRRKVYADIYVEDIFQENRGQNKRVRRSKLTRLLKHLGLYFECQLAAARESVVLIILDILVLPFSMIHLVKQSVTPELDSKSKNILTARDESSSAEEFFNAEKDLIFFRFFSGVDVIENVIETLLKIAFISVTLYNIPKLLTVTSRSLLSLCRRNSEEYSLIRELNAIVKDTRDSFMKILCGMLILICIVRIKPAFHRLKAHRKYQRRAEYERKIALKGPDPERISLDKITWDLYGNICQYLTITDLASLSQVNRKLNRLTDKDLYWKYQLKRDWLPDGAGDGTLTTFKKQCILLYEIARLGRIAKLGRANRKKRALTLEQRDRLSGFTHILLDEGVESLKAIPHLLLMPANAFSWLLLKIFRPVRHNEHFLNPRCDYFVTQIQLDVIYELKLSSFRVLNPTWKDFSSLHLDLKKWLILAFFKFYVECVHVLSYIGYTIIKTTSVGAFSPMRVEYEQERDIFMIIPQPAQANRAVNANLRLIFYCTQFVLSCVYVLLILSGNVLIAFYLLGPVLWEQLEDLHYLAAVLFVVFIQGCVVVDVFKTLLNIIKTSAPFFKPLEPFKLCYYYLINTLRGT